MKRFVFFRAELGPIRFELSYLFGLLCWLQFVKWSRWTWSVIFFRKEENGSAAQSPRKLTIDDLVQKVQRERQEDNEETRLRKLRHSGNISRDLSVLTGSSNVSTGSPTVVDIREQALRSIQERRQTTGAESPEEILASEIQSFCNFNNGENRNDDHSNSETDRNS